MKEYLTKNSNGDYQIVNHRFSDDDIEIPDGADELLEFLDGVEFYKDNRAYFFDADDSGLWRKTKYEIKTTSVLWQREQKYKEFLNKNDNYNLVMLPEHAGDDERSGLIEVPKGAEMFVYFNEFDRHNFYKGGFSAIWQDDGYWDNDMSDYIEYCKKDGTILWQRYTQHESLPFVDDEVQSINDQYAEIEQVRQQTIDATLAERQSTYGCFEDVAFVTENIINVLKKCNYNEMPHTHRMAMYMIASKMARLVNGDCNHLDSWHDIGGYAKLIENLIKGNNNG